MKIISNYRSLFKDWCVEDIDELKSQYIKTCNNNSRPLYVKVKITSICNANCPGCIYSRTNKENNKIDELNKNTLLRLLEDLCVLKCNVIGFSGGEPLLASSLPLAIITCKNNNIRCKLATNGLLLNSPRIQNLIIANVDHLIISLDSSVAQKHDKRRGIDGLWNAAVNGIKSIKKEIRSSPIIQVSTIISSENIAEIADIIRVFNDLGVDLLHLIPVDNIPNIMLNSFMVDMVNEQLEKIKQLNLRIKLTHRFPLGITENAKHLSTLGKYSFGLYSKILCNVHRFHSFIRSDGNVYPCCGFPIKNKLLGNINNTRFKKLWEKQQLQIGCNFLKSNYSWCDSCDEWTAFNIAYAKYNNC